MHLYRGVSMRRDTAPPIFPARAVADALRAVRRHRGLKQTDVAEALGISRRSYLDLEAGSGRILFDHLMAFADATDSDRIALVAAILFGKPDLAVQCADNKAMTVLMIAADDFAAGAGEALGEIRPQELMAVFEASFAALASDVTRRRDAERSMIQRLRRSAGDNPDDTDA